MGTVRQNGSGRLSGPKIAFIDIETSPIIAATWTLRDIQNVVWVERDTFLLSFAVLWSGERKVKTYCLPDFPGYAANRHDDRNLVGELFRVLSDADLVVAHNGDSFDIKKIQARLAVHGFPPPSPFKSIDTLKIARKHFKFDSNKLDNLGRYLGCGRKIPNTGADLWRRCVDGDPKAWELMRRYNAQDVLLLYRVFEKLKHWGGVPDLRPYAQQSSGCPTCLSNKIQRRGVAVARSRRYQRFQCQSCGAWFSGDKLNGEAA